MKTRFARTIVLIFIAVVLVSGLLIESKKISSPPFVSFIKEQSTVVDEPQVSSVSKSSIIQPSSVSSETPADLVIEVIEKNNEQQETVEKEISKETQAEEEQVKTQEEHIVIQEKEEPQKVEPTIFVPDVVPSLVNGQKKPETKLDKLIVGALEQYGVTNNYNGVYQRIAYPNGDVDPSTGVCTDVIIRAFRSINIDLQKEVHRDMSRHFRKYPRQWGLKHPDSNIDHRRVANLETYLTRKGYRVPVSKNTDTEHYRPGDLVVWRISGKLTHIGIVSDEIVPNTSRYFIIHNPVQGVEISDWLNEFEIINHFRVLEE